MTNINRAREALAAATRGPWFIDRRVPTLVRGDYERSVATTGGYQDNFSPPDTVRNENEANARAIVLAHAIAGPALELAEAVADPEGYCCLCGCDQKLGCAPDCKHAAFNAALNRALEQNDG